MSQPLHNNAIPAHPGIAAMQQGAVAPESAPVSTPIVETPSSEPSTEQVRGLWDAFDISHEAAPSPPPPVVEPTPAIQPPRAPEPPPEVPPSIEELLGSGAPAPVQAEPPAPVPQPAPQQPVAQPPVVDMAQLQKQAIDYLMANEYKLSDEDRSQLISAPDEVLPRLAARMHIGIAQQLAQQVAQAVPAMIQQHMDSHIKAQRAEMEFFSRYPKLNRPEWKETIAESLQMVKQMNPQATRDQVISEGAALAAFRINSKFGNRYTPQPPQPPRAPSPPYVPVAPGGGMAPPTDPSNQPNVWADLAAQDWNTW